MPKNPYFAKPGFGPKPGGVRTLLPTRPRIIIEFDPANSQSNLRTEGPLTVPLVIDTLLAQVNSLWSQFIRTVTSPVVGANGEPTYKNAPPAVQEQTLAFTTDSANPPDEQTS